MVTKNFEELFACFNARDVRAVVVGGYALAFHAKPRFTRDVDVFVEPTAENAERLVLALEDFGFAQPVFFLGLTELKRNKRASGRAQDLADLESL